MEDSYQNRSNAFIAWLREASAEISDNVALLDLRDQGAGRGVVATADIVKNELLFFIPRKTVLSVANSSLPQELPSVFADLDPWLSLILVMIYEHQRGESSPWKPYFDVLPATFNTLMFWTPEELADLQASAVVSKIGKEEADDTFREKLLPVVREYPDLFGLKDTFEVPDEEILAAAHRMGSTIMAYAFDIEPCEEGKEMDEEGYASEEEDEALPKGMVPLADMLNADADRNNARLFYEKDALTMKALKPIKAGEEIFNDYGQLPRSDMLRRYGYITPNYAQYDVVEIPQALVMETLRSEIKLSDAEIEERLSYLEEQQALELGYDIARLPSEDPASAFPPELLVLIATMLLSHEEFQWLKSKEKLPKPNMTPLLAKILKDTIVKHIAQYATDLETDRALIKAGQVSGRALLAVEVRIGEKEILHDAATWLDDYVKKAEDGKRSATNGDAGPSKRRKIA